LTVVVAGLNASSVATAQGAERRAGGRFLETRAGLDSLAKLADNNRQPNEAALIRARLRDGDFQEGDRIVLVYEPSLGTAVSETLTVRGTLAMEIPGYASVSLAGVLHSELHDKVLAHFKISFKDPVVRVNPLVRLAVQGSVTRPGYVYASPDAPLSDVLMLAGGQTAEADWPKTFVRRAGVVLWKASDLQQAIAQGLTVDRLQLRAGDEVFVAKKAVHNWTVWIQVALGVVTLILALTARR
jgi:protein involved in polysaccharide export with SLBB domain